MKINWPNQSLDCQSSRTGYALGNLTRFSHTHMIPAKWQASAIFKIAHLSNQRDQNKAQFSTKYPITTTTKRTLYRKQFNISIWRLASLCSCNPAATTYVLVSWQLTAPRCLQTETAIASALDHTTHFRIALLHRPPPRTWIKSHFWRQCRRRSGGGRTMLSVWSRQLGPQQRVLNAGTHQLSEAVKSHVFTGIRGDRWWLLLDCRDRRASTEMGAAVPGTPKLLSLFHDVLLLSETPNKPTEYTAPGLLNDPLNLRCDVTVWVLILAGLTKYPNHFLRQQQPPAQIGLQEDQRWTVSVVVEPSRILAHVVNSWVQGTAQSGRCQFMVQDVPSMGVSNPRWSRFCFLLIPPKRFSPLTSVDADCSNRSGHSDFFLHVTKFLGYQASPASLITPGTQLSLIPPESSALLLDIS